MNYRLEMQRAFEHWHDRRLNAVAKILARQTPAAGETDLRGIEWRVLKAELSAKFHILGKHAGPATECVLLPDGKEVVTTGEDGLVQLWDIETRSLKTTFDPRIGPIYSAAVSPDGTLLAIGGRPLLKLLDLARVHLIDLKTGKHVRALQRHDTSIESIAFSSDGQLIAAGSRYSTVRVSTIEGRLLHSFPAKRRNIRVTFSKDDAYLMALFDPGDNTVDRSIRIWNLTTGEVQREFPNPKVLSADWSPTGEEVIVAVTHDYSLTMIDPESGERLGRFMAAEPHPKEVSCFAFRRDGKRLVGADVEGNVHRWVYDAAAWRARSITTPQESLGSFTVHDGKISSVSVSNQGAIVSVCDDGNIALLTPDTSAVTRLTQRNDAVECVTVCANAETVYTSGLDGKIRRWNIGQGVGEVLCEAGNTPITAISVSADQSVLATIDAVGKILVFDAQSGELLWSPPVEVQTEYSYSLKPRLALSADGRLLAAASVNDVLRVWNVPAKKLVMTMSQINIHGVDLSPDGRFVAYGGIFESVYVREVASGKVVRSHPAGGRTSVVQFSPDGTKIVSAHWDGSVRLLDWTSEESVRVLRGHLKGVKSVTFSADGNSLISLGSENTGDGVRFWDVETGECYGGIDLPIGPSTSLHSFTAGSHYAALAFGDPPVVSSFLWILEDIGSPPGSQESEEASGADGQ